MVQRIQAPDGSVVEFPDGMNDGQIAAVMRREYGGPKPQRRAGLYEPQMQRYRASQQRGAENRASRAAGQNPIFQMGKDFLAPAKNALAGLRQGYDESVAQMHRGGPRSIGEALEDEKRSLGMVGNALGLIVSPITGVLDATVIKPAARGLEQIGLGDEGSNTNMLNTALMATKPGPRGAAAVRTPKPLTPAQRTVREFDRAGVEPNLAATKGKGAAAITNLVAENALAGIPARARLARQAGQAGAAANRQAAQYGTARGAANAGEEVQSGIRRFANDADTHGTFRARSAELYDDAFAPIEAAEAEQVARASKVSEANAATQATRAAEREALVARTANDAELESARRGHRVEPERVPEWEPAKLPAPLPVVRATQSSALLKEIGGRVNSSALSSIVTDPRLRTIAKALEADAGSVRFGDLRALRTWVREAKGSETLRQNISKADLARLEGSLTTDIYEAANRLGGPQALNRLRRADQYYAAGSSRIQNALKPFESAKSGENAYGRILQAAGSTSSADIRKVVSLKRSLAKDEWGDVAATIISDMGKPTAGVAGVADDGFSVSTFMTNYNKLSRAGREALFGSLGGGGARATSLKAELDNLARVVDKLKAVERGANVSKSGVTAQNMVTLGGLVSPALPATLKILGTMAAAGEVLTNPAFVRWIARVPKAPAALPAHMRRLDALVATYPELANFREELRKELDAKQVGQDYLPADVNPAQYQQAELNPAP